MITTFSVPSVTRLQRIVPKYIYFSTVPSPLSGGVTRLIDIYPGKVFALILSPLPRIHMFARNQGSDGGGDSDGD